MAAPSFCFRLVSDSLTNPHRPLAPPRLSPQLDAHLSELSVSLEPSNSFDVTGVNVALAMAGLVVDDGPVAIADVAAVLERKTTSLSTVRGRLIVRDLIYPAGRGLLRFRIPYFPEFVASSEGNLRTIS